MGTSCTPRALALAPHEAVYQQSLEFFKQKAGYASPTAPNTPASVAAPALNPDAEHPISGPYTPVAMPIASTPPAPTAVESGERRVDASHHEKPPMPQTVPQHSKPQTRPL